MASLYSLINSQGCCFDNCLFDSEIEALKWAKGRGGNYSLVIAGDSSMDDELIAEYRNGRKVPTHRMRGSLKA